MKKKIKNEICRGKKFFPKRKTFAFPLGPIHLKNYSDIIEISLRRKINLMAQTHVPYQSTCDS